MNKLYNTQSKIANKIREYFKKNVTSLRKTQLKRWFFTCTIRFCEKKIRRFLIMNYFFQKSFIKKHKDNYSYTLKDINNVLFDKLISYIVQKLFERNKLNQFLCQENFWQVKKYYFTLLEFNDYYIHLWKE